MAALCWSTREPTASSRSSSKSRATTRWRPSLGDGLFFDQKLPDGQFLHGQYAPSARRANLPQRLRLRRRANQKHISAHPAVSKRDVSRSSRTLAVGCDGRGLSDRRSSRSRTEKSCGPGAPTLALNRRYGPLMTGAKKPGHRGARRKPLKPSRAGMPGDSGEPAASTPVLSCCTGGCGCIGHPAFPTPSRAKRTGITSGATRRGARTCVCGRECRRRPAS
jgi:hypothetical protein